MAASGTLRPGVRLVASLVVAAGTVGCGGGSSATPDAIAPGPAAAPTVVSAAPAPSPTPVPGPVTLASTSLALEVRAQGHRLWVTNPDGDTVTVLESASGTKAAEIVVGASPRTVAVAADGRIWLTVQQDPAVVVIDPDTLRVVARHALPRASQPFGVVAGPDGTVWVALAASGTVLRLDSEGRMVGQVAVGPDPRHLALTHDGSRMLVSRFITRPMPGEATAQVQTRGTEGAEVIVLDPGTLRIERTVVLRHGNRVDTSESARGIPNYLGAAAVSPDGRLAWVPSKQDNIARGLLRDRRELDFQSTVRAVSSRIDLQTLTEDTDRRFDHDNASLAAAATWHPGGRWLFVALETSRQVAVVDTLRGLELMRLEAGLAPQAVVASPDGLRLFVHNFMSRSVFAYDLAPLLAGSDIPAPPLWTAQTMTAEPLDPVVLRGKQLFYDARDRRLARDAYMSCATCHADGGHDGRVWDLTGLGEGLRNTVSLRGRRGAQGLLHWSANFDEVQDFEAQIRRLAGGTGLMRDEDLALGTRAQPLGDRKAGVSSDLDALAAYVTSLDRFDPSPHRSAAGQLTSLALDGQALFSTRGCVQCHGGSTFTSSGDGQRHSIGTIRPSSGQRLGAPLDGIDPPTLRDAWSTAPYLHDGSATTLVDAIRAHRNLVLSEGDVEALARFVLEIGNGEPGASP